MKDRNHLIVALLSVVATIIVGWAAVEATWKTAKWGGSPPKSLQASYFGPADPLLDLGKAEGGLTVLVENDGKKVSNLRIASASIENNGDTPILPEDMFEPLSISSEEPWKIVIISEQKAEGESGIDLNWTKISDNKFLSNKSLINPGDRIDVLVYMTWGGEGDVPDIKKPPIKWGARISNMKGISIQPDLAEKLSSSMGSLMVTLFGWGVVFMLVSFFVYNFLTISFIIGSGIFKENLTVSVMIYSLAGLLNIAASESGSTLIFGDFYSLREAPNLLLNLPPIIANAMMLAALGVLTWRRNKADRHKAT